MTACARTTCCSDEPGCEPTPACYDPSACGCRVVQHSDHPTPSMTGEGYLVEHVAPDNEVLAIARDITERRPGLMDRLSKYDGPDPTPSPADADWNAWAHLSNDVSEALRGLTPRLLFSQRQAIARDLWRRGYRK